MSGTNNVLANALSRIYLNSSHKIISSLENEYTDNHVVESSNVLELVTWKEFASRLPKVSKILTSVTPKTSSYSDPPATETLRVGR